MLRAIGRLCAAVFHLLRGIGTVWRHFSTASVAEQQAHVGRWAAALLRILGVTLHRAGPAVPPDGALLIVANHVSWLDIVVVHAICPQARFVSKAGVRHWPVIGRLTLAARTLFIERESKRDALRVVHHVADALRDGDTVAVFPEGTTSDGTGLLPFHANLLQAAVTTGAPVQPLALRYEDDEASPSLAAAYIGTTTLVHSVWSVVRAPGLRVQVTVLPLQAPEGGDRRALAQRCHRVIGAALGQAPAA